MVIQKPYNLNKSRIPTTLPVALSVLQLQHNSLNRRGWWQARLRTLSILLADNDDIRFLSALGIFSSETGYGQIFDRSWFFKKNSQVLVKILLAQVDVGIGHVQFSGSFRLHSVGLDKKLLKCMVQCE